MCFCHLYRMPAPLTSDTAFQARIKSLGNDCFKRGSNGTAVLYYAYANTHCSIPYAQGSDLS